MTRWQLMGVASVGLICACGDTVQPETVCTLIGCASVAELDVLKATDTAILYDTSIEVCLNQHCATGPMPNIPYYWGQTLSGDLVATVVVDPDPPGSGVLVVGKVYFSDPTKDVPTNDGDVYTAAVFAHDGTTLGAGSWSATQSA